jgi:hypothetical protein
MAPPAVGGAMTWWMIGATILLLLLLVVTVYLIYQLETIKDRVTATLSPLFAIFMFLLTAFKPTELPPDYILLHQPWLESVLTISQLKEGLFKVSYDITNHGKLPVNDPRLFFVSPTMRHVDKSLQFPKVISPGGTFVYRPNLSPFEIQRLPKLSYFVLAIDYSAQVGDKKRAFRSVSRVGLRMDELKEGPHIPLSVVHEEGEFSDQWLEKFLGFEMDFRR